MKRVHDYIRNLLSGPNKGRNCFLITLNILLSLRKQSFSIDIVWQITTVIVKSCGQRKQSFSIDIVWQITTVIVKSCGQLHLVDPVIHSFPAKAILL